MQAVCQALAQHLSNESIHCSLLRQFGQRYSALQTFVREAARRSATMGLTFTKLFARLFSKKEMRILMVRSASFAALW